MYAIKVWTEMLSIVGIYLLVGALFFPIFPKRYSLKEKFFLCVCWPMLCYCLLQALDRHKRRQRTKRREANK